MKTVKRFIRLFDAWTRINAPTILLGMAAAWGLLMLSWNYSTVKLIGGL